MKRLCTLIWGITLFSIYCFAQETQKTDLFKSVLVRFPFDNGISQDSTTAFELGVKFRRESIAYADGKTFKEHEPKLVKGKNGNGILLESAYENLLPEGQASAKDVSLFKTIGSEITVIKGNAYEGDEAISVLTKGEHPEEGLMLDLTVDKLMYLDNKAVPVAYVASLYLKGNGNIKMVLKTADGEIQSEPLYESLTSDWKRFSCCIYFKEASYQIGAKHEQDWKTLLPSGTNIETKIEFHILTQDQNKMQFFADAFQMEARYLHYPNTGGGASPHTWVPGKMRVKGDYFGFETRVDYFREFKKTGSMSFWMKPLWDVRDSTLDVIINMTPNALRLQHASSSFVMSPAGISYRPFDFKDQWHHVVITWNETGERKLYVDSMEYANQNEEKAPIKSLQFFNLGDGGSALPNAVIDDLILFESTLTAEQVSQIAQWQELPLKTVSANVKKETDVQDTSSNTEKKPEEKKPEGNM